MSPIFLIPLVYFASVLQSGLASRWEVAGAGPDLLALTAISWAVKSAAWRGLAVAAAIGFISDLNSSAPLGVGIALYSAAAYGVIWWHRQMNLDRLPGQIAAVWLGVTAITLSEFVASRCLGQSTPTLDIVIERTAAVGLYTTTIALPLLIIMSWLAEKQLPLAPPS